MVIYLLKIKPIFMNMKYYCLLLMIYQIFNKSCITKKEFPAKRQETGRGKREATAKMEKIKLWHDCTKND